MFNGGDTAPRSPTVTVPEMTISDELAAHFEFAKPTLSRHFNVLREADLIQGTKRGATITYRLNVSVLEEALLPPTWWIGIFIALLLPLLVILTIYSYLVWRNDPNARDGFGQAT